MINPRRGEKDRLGRRTQRLDDAGQKDSAQEFRALGAARLARRDGLDPRRAQAAHEMADLGRFADALPAFERDQFSARARCALVGGPHFRLRFAH